MPHGEDSSSPSRGPDPTFRLDGRTALVTGSTADLGLAMARGLAGAGAKVALNYANDHDRAREAFAAFQADGLQGGLFPGSVIDEGEIGDLVERIEASLGPIDILVVNATPDQPHMPIEDYDWEFHQSMLDFFIRSPFLLTRAVLPGMKSRRWGRIINIGSEVVSRGVGDFSPYVAAKGGQNGWNRSMATELAPWNITVNMVSPGWIPVARHDDDPQDEKDAYRELIPLGRWGVPEDVAGCVTFLAGDASGFITAQNIHVNGGMTVH